MPVSNIVRYFKVCKCALFLISVGFRSWGLGRMAGWMWLRCIFGPHLQRIHRSPDQSRSDGRAARRVRFDRGLHVFEWSRMLKRGVFSSLRVSVSQTESRKFEVFVIESLLSSHWVTGVNEWMYETVLVFMQSKVKIRVCFLFVFFTDERSRFLRCLRRWHWPGFANASKERTLPGINS